MKISYVAAGIFFIAAVVPCSRSLCFATPIAVPTAASSYVAMANPRSDVSVAEENLVSLFNIGVYLARSGKFGAANTGGEAPKNYIATSNISPVRLADLTQSNESPPSNRYIEFGQVRFPP